MTMTIEVSEEVVHKVSITLPKEMMNQEHTLVVSLVTETLERKYTMTITNGAIGKMTVVDAVIEPKQKTFESMFGGDL
jgi:hypothetical protein